MLDNIYNNIGNKIKILAKFIFIIESIITVILGIYLIAVADDNQDSLRAVGIFTILLGPIIAWISSWLLYAFGQLVDDTQEIRNTSSKTHYYSDEVKSTQNVISTTKETAILPETTETKTTPTPPEIKDIPEGNKYYIDTKKDKLVCLKCGFEQPTNRNVCWQCGIKFEREE